MNKFRFGKASTRHLQSCHIDIQAIMHAVIAKSDVDFTIADGYRSEKEQEDAFRNGFSKAHFGQSPHNIKPSPAVDVVPYSGGALQYEDDEAFDYLAKLIRDVNDDLFERRIVAIKLVWGNDWDDDGIEVKDDQDETFADKPHWQAEDWKERRA